MATPRPEPQYIRTIRAATLGFWWFGGMAAGLAGIVGIAYFVVAEQWAAAIFVLLARKELTRWMKRNGDDLYEAKVKQPLSEV